MNGEQDRAGDLSVWQDIPTLLAAAHELKSPLVLIRQLALSLEEGGDAQSAHRIRLTAERSLALIEGLTRAARLDDALFECEPINVGELYESVAHEMTPLAAALQQRIILEIPRSQPTVIGNRSLLRSVIVGLTDNALSHNDRSHPVVLKAVDSRGDRVMLGVKDFGPRTDHMREIKRRLGTPQPMSSRPRSSGLGLLIAEQFARHMDAHLSLIRHREAGVTFALDVPRSRQLTLLEMI